MDILWMVSNALLNIHLHLLLRTVKYEPILLGDNEHIPPYQKTKCFLVKGRTVAGGASHNTPSALTSYVSGSTLTNTSA